MGRPLYSRAFTNPTVRDPVPPICEKWSHLNAFDPDSDEFFANENAVYEDFIDPVAPVTGEDEERDMLVVRMGNASPITSESSLSDNDPLEEPDSFDEEDTFHNSVSDVRQAADRVGSARVQPAVHVRLAHRPHPLHFTTRSVSLRPPPRSFARDDLPTPSAPIPVPTISRHSTSPILSPSTPPRPIAPLAMSPPPTSTPRLYSWARNHPATPSSGPFTNPHARTSYTHLSPVLIRIRDVTV